MQLNVDYKLLSIRSQACYSCKGQHYWEGCYRKEKADCLLSERMMRDENVFPRSSPLTGDEKQERVLLTRAAINFPLNV